MWAVCEDKANLGFKRVKRGELSLFGPASGTIAYEARVGSMTRVYFSPKIIEVSHGFLAVA